MEPIKLIDCFSWTVKEDPIAEIIMALNAKNYYSALS